MRHPLPPPRSRPGGFSLMELMVVVVLIGIAAAVVVPYAADSGPSALSAARMIASDLQYAQNVAITEQTSVSVEFNAAGNNYGLRYYQSGYLKHPITKADYFVDFDRLHGLEAVAFVPDFGGSSTVTFDVLGAPQPTGGGSVTIRAGRHVYRLDVAPATGTVTVRETGS